jgi:peptidylprolyl isomerase
MHRLPTLAILAVSALAGGCSSASPPATRVEAVSFAPELGVDLAASTRTASGLYYRDIQVGTGAVAESGSPVTVFYSGALQSGFVFDGTKPGDPPLAFRIGRGRPRPIAGFEQGVTGMRVGGKRQIIIPPELGYGRAGNDPVPPNAVLVFTVELLGVG